MWKGQKLSDTITAKVLAFIDNDRVIHDQDVQAIEGARGDDAPYIRGLWVVLAIPGYNNTTYTVHHDQLKRGTNTYHVFRCNCQYAVSKNKLCSHVLAVILESGHHPSDPGIVIEGGVRKAPIIRGIPDQNEEGEYL